MVHGMDMRRIGMLGLVLALTACETTEVRDTLGLTRRAPDEFVVVSRPALSVPPEFALVPPDPNATGPRASTQEQARSALIGTSVSGGESVLGSDWKGLMGDRATPSDLLTSEFEEQPDGALARRATSASVSPVAASTMGSAAESRLLNQMGADKADPGIRAKLGEDERVEPETKEEAKSLYESWIGADTEQPVVDAKAEAERLRKNKDAGKKPNEGEIAVEDEKKSRSVLDTLF